MTDTVTTTAAPAGHFGGAGLDQPSLNLMLEALPDIVDGALSPDLSPAVVTAAYPFCTTMLTGASSYGATTAATSEQ